MYVTNVFAPGHFFQRIHKQNSKRELENENLTANEQENMKQLNS